MYSECKQRNLETLSERNLIGETKFFHTLFSPNPSFFQFTTRQHKVIPHSLGRGGGHLVDMGGPQTAT